MLQKNSNIYLKQKMHSKKIFYPLVISTLPTYYFSSINLHTLENSIYKNHSIIYRIVISIYSEIRLSFFIFPCLIPPVVEHIE